MKTDVIVIGSGPGGSSVAKRCAKAGKKVVIVDRLFGGVCALRGCTPKKAMESVTSAYWKAKDMEKAGFPTLSEAIDWSKLAAHKSKFTTTVPAKTKSNFKEAGIRVIEGTAELIDPNTVVVDGKKIIAETIVIATGAKPRHIDIPGNEYMLNNDQFFALDNITNHVTIIGGGYIAFEFAHIMAACGVHVTILSNEEMPLGAFDPDLVNNLIQATLAKGVDVKLGYEAISIEHVEGEYIVKSKRSDGETFDFKAGLVIHAAGRVPNIDKLGLDNLKIKLNNRGGIETNKFLQISNHPNIYALGDVTGKLPFTEIASYEAKIVTHNILEKRRKSVDYTGMPIGVFTYPSLCMVGKTEEELKKEKVDYLVMASSNRSSFTERVHLNTFARYKTLVHKNNNKILGASLIGIHAEEVINLYAMAIQQGITATNFNSQLFQYPTAGNSAKYFL